MKNFGGIIWHTDLHLGAADPAPILYTFSSTLIRLMAFVATFKDGYKRTIALKTQSAAMRYAKDLEVWFAEGFYPERILINVAPKK